MVYYKVVKRAYVSTGRVVPWTGKPALQIKDETIARDLSRAAAKKLLAETPAPEGGEVFICRM